MKKIIFCISALCLFLYVNAFSQTVMNHANDINDAGKSAAQSHNATHSRSINNAAWDGSHNVSRDNPSDSLVYIDVISDKGYGLSHDKPSNFDSPKSRNNTLWKNILIGMISALGAAISLLIFSSAIIGVGKNDLGSDKKIINAIQSTMSVSKAFAGIAMTLFVAILVLATVIIIRNNQYALGAAWAGAAIFGIGACTGIMSGVNGAKKYESAADYAKRIKMVQKTGMAAAGVLAASGVALGYYSYKAVSLIINSNLL